MKDQVRARLTLCAYVYARMQLIGAKIPLHIPSDFKNLASLARLFFSPSRMRRKTGWFTRLEFVIIFFFFFFFFKRPTAPLVSPETMIQSPNCFALPCAGPFHKINAGYEATTTTVNSSCLMYGYYILRRHFTKLTRD